MQPIYGAAAGVMGWRTAVGAIWWAMQRREPGATSASERGGRACDLGAADTRRIVQRWVRRYWGQRVADLTADQYPDCLHLGTGSVTWLNNASLLMEFPTAMLGVALGGADARSLPPKTSQDHERFSA